MKKVFHATSFIQESVSSALGHLTNLFKLLPPDILLLSQHLSLSSTCSKTIQNRS
jgi:hypothetical protein